MLHKLLFISIYMDRWLDISPSPFKGMCSIGSQYITLLNMFPIITAMKIKTLYFRKQYSFQNKLQLYSSYSVKYFQ